MSNDQSPPARKVIPYRKGGPRKSPFADMAFQFSGTALDVAIQQREEGTVAPGEASETPSRESSEHEHATAPVASIGPQIEPAEALNEKTLESSQSVDDNAVLTQAVSPLPAAKPQPHRRRTPVSSHNRRGGPTASETSDEGLQAFINRWKPFLTETQLGICAYVYNNSAAVGQEYCFTSTTKLMSAVSKTERQVKTVLNQLTDWGFLIKGETVVNAPREQRGTYYRLEVTKS